jgi:predicted permease
MGGVVTNGGVRFPGDDKRRQTYFLDCSDSFLRTVGIKVLLGRDLDRADFDGGIRSAVVNDIFVSKYLPGVNPIGQIFYPPDWGGTGGTPEPFTIVGVAKDAHYRGVRDEVPPTAYVPFSARPPSDGRMVFMIRTRVEPLNLVSAVRKAVASVDANLPVAEVRTERDQIDRSLGTERMFATLVSAFGAIALILAAVGLYGVMAFSVARRTSEIGIRVALGARRGNVQWLILRQSLFLTLLGVVVGIPCALALTGLVKKLLFGVKPNDPASIAGAVAVMLAVAACAAWIPARRASRVDPTSALRHE